MLYHGTWIKGLHVIKANATSHATGQRVAYFTADRCYALVCCRDAANNFVTMGLREDGKQHYYERFPDQLKTLYGGKAGYLYYVETADGLTNTRGRTWESSADVRVEGCETINDVYAALLEEEARGALIIHRYDEIDPAEQKMHANYMKEHLAEQTEAMRQFYIAHFSALWD